MPTNDNVMKDLTDSARDIERLKPETASLDLPEWNDIPGQKSGQAAQIPGDVTASSSDEEGEGLLDDTDQDDEVGDIDKELLDQPYDPSYDADLPVGEISLDDSDDDGDRLEEDGPEQSLLGKDLDDNLEEEEDEEDQDTNSNPE